MREVILSMARIPASIRRVQYRFYVYSRGDGQMDKDKRPHGHIIRNGDSLVSMSLDLPFKVIHSREVHGNKVPNDVISDIQNYLARNTEYIHYIWDLCARQRHYAYEYAGDLSLLNILNTRLVVDGLSDLLRG